MRQLKTSFACASLLGMMLAAQTNAAWGTVVTVCPACTITTIQDGIDAAVSGDTVLVSAGTYNENITMKPGVNVVSEGDDTHINYVDPFGQVPTVVGPTTVTNEYQVLERATQTMIQGLGEDTVVTFPAGADAVLDGFIVENIDDTALADTPLIKVDSCSPTIKNNIVRDNQGPGQNGGIAITGGTEVVTPLIQDNIIHYVNGHGIGVFSKSYPTIIHNEIFTTPPVIDPSPILGFPYREAPGIGFHDDSAAIILDNHIFLNGAGGISSRGHVIKNPDNTYTVFDGVYDLPGYAFDIKRNTIHHHSTSAGIYIMGKEGTDPTSGVNFTIGGPDKNLDKNTIYENRVGVRTGFWNNNTGKYLGTALIQHNDIHDNGRPGIWVREMTSAEVKNNTLTSNRRAGIRTGGNKDLTIETNEITGGSYAGIKLGNNDLSYTVSVQNNKINNNFRGGIIVEAVSLNAALKNNEINGNGYGGIHIRGGDLNIEDNEIAGNQRGGIHTGADPTGFQPMLGTPGQFTVTILGNKVHNNGIVGYGAGIDVRHVGGTIENNLVYDNATAGIRFGDWISAINHNTIVDNGAPGITYHDPEGAVIGPMSGYPPAPFPIKNNILVGNAVFGVNPGTAPPWPDETVCDACKCDQWKYDRDFNLVSSNDGLPASDDDEFWYEEYGCMIFEFWPDHCFDLSDSFALAGFITQIGMCGPYYQLYIENVQPAIRNNEIYKEPGFIDADNNDYHLQLTSAAVDAGDPTMPIDNPLIGLGDPRADMGAYGGPDAIDWENATTW